MLQWLLLLSFILHAVSLYWILRMKQHLHDNNNEIEHLLAVYTEDMKAENEKLLKWLDHSESADTLLSSEDHHTAVNSTVGTEVSVQTSQEDPSTVRPQSTVLDEIANEPTTEANKESTNRSLNERVLTLSEQGMDNAEIAKKLDCGIGVVELLLKFHFYNVQATKDID